MWNYFFIKQVVNVKEEPMDIDYCEDNATISESNNESSSVSSNITKFCHLEYSSQRRFNLHFSVSLIM